LFNRFYGRRERAQDTRTDLRGWVAAIRQLLVINATDSSDGEKLPEEIRRDLLDFLNIFDSFENPDSIDFQELLDEEYRADSIITEKNIINELEIDSNMSDMERIALLSRMRDYLIPKIHAFVTSNVPDAKQNERTQQTDKIHSLIGQFDTNTKERIKSPEVGFLIFYLISHIFSIFTENPTLLATINLAQLGYLITSLIDYSQVTKSLNAMDYTDNPIETSIKWIKRDLLAQTEQKSS